MPHNKHVEDGFNIDIGMMQPDEAKNYYLDLAGDWEDPNPPPRIVMHDSIRVVRDDEAGHRDVNHSFARILNDKLTRKKQSSEKKEGSTLRSK